MRLSDGRTIDEVFHDQSRSFRPLEPPAPSPEEARQEETAGLLAAIIAGQDRIVGLLEHLRAREQPGPQVHVDAPDLSVLDALVARPHLTAAEIADAIASRIGAPAADDQVAPALAAVVAELKTLGKKVTALSIMPSGGASGHVIVDSGIISSITQPVTTIEQASTQEQQLDYATRTDGNPVYVGNAAAGSSTGAAVWRVQKLTYDSSARLIRLQVQSNIAWDDRAAGW